MGGFASREFLAFLVTGGIAAAVNFGSRIVLGQWLSFPVAVVVAYLLGMAVAFALARAFVFGAGTGTTLRQSAARFAIVNLAAIAQTWGVSMLLAYWLLPALGVVRHVELIAHAVGIAVPVFTSYLGHKHWSFR